MENVSFASVYRRDSSQVKRAADIEPTAIDWGHFFGEVLFDQLAKVSNPEVVSPENAQAYDDWWNHHFVFDYWRRLLGNDPEQQLTSSHGYHLINGMLFQQWNQLLENSVVRNRSISEQQEGLAVIGLGLYMRREQLYKHYLKTGQTHPQRSTIEGMLNECDAGIVLLEIQRRNPTIERVLAAPYQFECDDPRYNVDFVLVGAQHSVGVQVKSAVRPEDVVVYDRDRVVLLDASADRGNVLAKKVSGRSTSRMMGWAGIICAQRLHEMRSEGKDSLAGYENDRKLSSSLIRFKFLARQS